MSETEQNSVGVSELQSENDLLRNQLGDFADHSKRLEDLLPEVQAELNSHTKITRELERTKKTIE